VGQKNYLPLESAKNIIITALDEFDPELGTRAAEILLNDEQLNIVEVKDAKTNMMQCRAAGTTIEDVKAAGMYISDFAHRFGPHFTHQDNPTDHAIIDFEYDGHPRAIIWLAHELGHAIADGIHIENGRSSKNYSGAEHEEQAYFVQHIVSQYLKENLKHLDVQDEDLGQDVLKMSWDRAVQFTNAGKIFEEALTNANMPAKRKSVIMAALDQRAPR
jgi:oligoendopeptidase F